MIDLKKKLTEDNEQECEDLIKDPEDTADTRDKRKILQQYKEAK